MAVIDVLNVNFAPEVWAVRIRIDMDGEPFVAMWKFATEEGAQDFADDRPAVLSAVHVLYARMVPVYISHVTGRCAVCGLPILDDGRSDDPEGWEHSWAQRQS